MNTVKTIILILLLIIIFYLHNQSNENFINTTEAIANLSSMFNNGSIIANKISVLNSLDISGNVNISGNTTSNNTTSNNTTSNNTTSNNIRTKYITGVDASGIIFGSDVSGIIMPLMYRKYMVAGYFKVKAYGYKVPLYYGWNILWKNDQSDRIASRLMVYEYTNSRSINNVSNAYIDTRDGGNNNWYPRGLVLFPGYYARLLYWDINSTNNDTFSSGIYNWITPINNKNVHLIHITLQEEGPSTHTFQCQNMSNYADNADVSLTKYPTKMPGSNTDFKEISQ